MISTLFPSLIRTYVPVLVGAFIAWLITLGVELDPEIEQGLTVSLTALLIAVYYTVVRLLEKRWSWMSVLLGSAHMPAQYTTDGVAVITTLPAVQFYENQASPYQPSEGSEEQGAGNYPTQAATER